MKQQHLQTLALLKNKKGGAALEKAITFLANSKTNYGFGSTQSTVLAMKALVEYAQFSKKFQEAGKVEILVDGKKVKSQDYAANQQGVIVFENLEQLLKLKKGESTNHQIGIKFLNTENPLNYDFQLQYTTAQPQNSDKCLVDLKTKLVSKKAQVGENIRLSTILTNKSFEPIANTIVMVGIPAGLSVQPWQLKELLDKGVFDYYELMPNGYIAFHYRGMEASEKKEINLDLKADIPGDFEAPASSAYLYYWNEEKVWSQPEEVTIE